MTSSALDPELRTALQFAVHYLEFGWAQAGWIKNEDRESMSLVAMVGEGPRYDCISTAVESGTLETECPDRHEELLALLGFDPPREACYWNDEPTRTHQEVLDRVGSLLSG